VRSSVRSAIGTLLVTWAMLGAGCGHGAPPPALIVVHVEPPDLSTDLDGDLVVHTDGGELRPSGVELVRWPGLEPVPATLRTGEEGGVAAIWLAPEAALAPGWYGVRVRAAGISWSGVDMLAIASNDAIARFGVERAPQASVLYFEGSHVVLRFSEALVAPAQWVASIRLQADGTPCEHVTTSPDSAPTREIAFTCVGPEPRESPREMTLDIGAGVDTTLGRTITAIAMTFTMSEAIFRFEPL
jgi:hypothetical protein